MYSHATYPYIHCFTHPFIHSPTFHHHLLVNNDDNGDNNIDNNDNNDHDDHDDNNGNNNDNDDNYNRGAKVVNEAQGGGEIAGALMKPAIVYPVTSGTPLIATLTLLTALPS